MAGETSAQQRLIQEHGSIVLRVPAELSLKDNWQSLHRLAATATRGGGGIHLAPIFIQSRIQLIRLFVGGNSRKCVD